MGKYKDQLHYALYLAPTAIHIWGNTKTNHTTPLYSPPLPPVYFINRHINTLMILTGECILHNDM